MGLHFAIPKKGYKFRRGKWDTDYVVHTVTPEKGSAVLQLWFGVGPMDLAPRLELLGGSTNVQIRRFSAGRSAVQDSRGQSEQGYWRQVALGWAIAGRESGEGAIYEGASREDAAKLDIVLDSACYVPSPRK